MPRIRGSSEVWYAPSQGRGDSPSLSETLLLVEAAMASKHSTSSSLQTKVHTAAGRVNQSYKQKGQSQSSRDIVDS